MLDNGAAQNASSKAIDPMKILKLWVFRNRASSLRIWDFRNEKEREGEIENPYMELASSYARGCASLSCRRAGRRKATNRPLRGARARMAASVSKPGVGEGPLQTRHLPLRHFRHVERDTRRIFRHWYPSIIDWRATMIIGPRLGAVGRELSVYSAAFPGAR
jgi:hypothetical protein